MGTGRPPTYTWLYVGCQAACAARVRVLPASPRAPHTVRRCPCSARERRARGGGAGADSGRRGPPAWAGAHICDVRLYARNAQVYSIPRVCLVALPCGGQRGVHNVFIKSAKREFDGFSRLSTRVPILFLVPIAAGMVGACKIQGHCRTRAVLPRAAICVAH